jgi:hypothetical protein
LDNTLLSWGMASWGFAISAVIIFLYTGKMRVTLACVAIAIVCFVIEIFT